MAFNHFVYTWTVLLLVIHDTRASQKSIISAPYGVVLESMNVLLGTHLLLSQEGKTVNITCKQSNAAATGVHFQLHEKNAAGGPWTRIPLTSSKPVWTILPDAGKQYRCVANNSAGAKRSKFYKSDVISIKINECKQLVQSLDCTCKAVSKIGEANLNVAFYPNGFEDKRLDFYLSRAPTEQKVIKNGVINRISWDLSTMRFATAIQCRLSTYNGKKPANRIEHQRKVDVTSPYGVVLESMNVLPGTHLLLSQEGKTVNITCKQRNAAATGVQFQLHEKNAAGGPWTRIPLTSSNPVWTILPDAGKQYRCVANNSAGAKRSKFYKSDVISLKINECKQLVQSLDCTCKAVSKIGDANLNVAFYPNGFEDKRLDFYLSRAPTEQKVIKNGVINRISWDLSTMRFATAIQCRLSTYNGKKPANRIEHQRKVDVTYFRPDFKKSGENETNAAYIVTIYSYPMTKEVTCDPPAVVQNLSNSQWNITIPIVDSTTTDYSGQCLADGKNENVIDVAGYHRNAPTGEAGGNGETVGIASSILGFTLFLVLTISFVLWYCGNLRFVKNPKKKEQPNGGNVYVTIAMVDRDRPNGTTRKLLPDVDDLSRREPSAT
ncbi:uncharacterized protein LOC141906812 isoform X2 [Tubulanus polymorphus]|uniref:uncharacterized protein LOC141906812 isoform X2 n=1 Tax=Tubulanus polymorphus TaxID=672921 RepID=UPI003DA60740